MFIKIALSLLLGYLFIFGFNTKVYFSPEEKYTDTPSNIATTTETVVKNSTTTTEKIEGAATSTKTKLVTVKKENLPVSPQIIPTPPSPPPDFEAINAFTRKSIVNILCTTKGGELSPISGTGIVVSSEGLILTNAHVGQYLLLKDFSQKDFIECVARTGSPAYPKYKLELVYISPLWVEKNKSLLNEQNPQGNGENDYAFLRVTGMIDGSTFTKNLPFLVMNVREVIDVGESTLLASYPAGFLGGLSILQGLSITSAVAKVSDYFTYEGATIDLISVPGTVVSQKGSSGGAVVDGDATLIGIITTSSEGNSTSERDLRAITLAYINRSLQKELGLNLVQFMSQDMTLFAKKFQEINAPALTKLISDELLK